MCGISGFFSATKNYRTSEHITYWQKVLDKMNLRQKHRGPDDEGTCLHDHCGLAHVRLSILDPDFGHQPMTYYDEMRRCSIVHNGEIYNMKKLRLELKRQGISFETDTDTEVILKSYMFYGIDFVKKLNGIFSFAIYDSAMQRLMLFRDPLGVKPLFYYKTDTELVFASEIKSLFMYPKIAPIIDDYSMREIFGLGPARTYGHGVFKNVFEVLPGHILICDKNGMTDSPYWQLKAVTHTEDLEETLEHTRYLVTSAIKDQMLSDVPICTFLSGGVDSSIVTSVCASELASQGKKLSTYSFDFKDNDIYFRSNRFQPSQDRPWVDKMIGYSNTDHTYLTCTNSDQLDCLYKCVDARDLPCMADVEASMLYFCEQVAQHHKVTLTGECSDEIFGGYPWYHDHSFIGKTAADRTLFPWSKNIRPREAFLRDDVIEALDLDSYVKNAYQRTIDEAPVCKDSCENIIEDQCRQLTYLNIRWFMATLLDRMDRTSMFCGLEARVPLADTRILSYIYNVPWKMKAMNSMPKGLLRHSLKGLLPDDVLFRPKSPYPKTYDPDYEKLLALELLEILHDASAPLNTYVDPDKATHWLNSPSDYGSPFYGQLMARPQQIAYLLQINYWLTTWK